jgi:hypothetical protein
MSIDASSTMTRSLRRGIATSVQALSNSLRGSGRGGQRGTYSRLQLSHKIASLCSLSLSFAVPAQLPFELPLDQESLIGA